MGKSGSHRQKHRQQSHNQSHAEGTITPVLQGHPLVPTAKADWIDTQSDFMQLCEELEASGIFAYDTEFIGEDSYFPHTCLIQVATTKRVALVDPFVIKDLSRLHALIASPDVTTLLHSGSQDLEPVARIFGSPPAAIFDTQLAAGFVGYPWPISLTKLIESILHHDVGGHFTFSQWDARPLSNRQRFYAADDVRYLIAIHEVLEKRLEKLNRTAWAEKEFSKFTLMETYEFNLFNTVKRICKNKAPRKKEIQRIQALATIRETFAIQLDLPTRAVIPNECLLGLAKKPVETIEQLASMRGFPRNMANRFGEQILQAILDAPSLEPFEMRKPQPIEKEAETRQELDGIWSLFGAWCVGKKLSAGLVTNRPTFTDWFLALREGKLLGNSPLQEGWRGESVKEFENMILGDGKISFSYNKALQTENFQP
ncbi:MAG: HRDC domain-containing protein [Phycisphaerales bacterium]|nr:HRDC domain-containing protein [Phycisphaerales bacterium]